MYLAPAPQNTLQAAKAEDKLMMEKLLDAINLEVRLHSQVGPISLPIFCREKHACGQLPWAHLVSTYDFPLQPPPPQEPHPHRPRWMCCTR